MLLHVRFRNLDLGDLARPLGLDAGVPRGRVVDRECGDDRFALGKEEGEEEKEEEEEYGDRDGDEERDAAVCYVCVCVCVSGGVWEDAACRVCLFCSGDFPSNPFIKC